MKKCEVVVCFFFTLHMSNIEGLQMAHEWHKELIAAVVCSILIKEEVHALSLHPAATPREWETLQLNFGKALASKGTFTTL